jgi:adenylyltransferase/sulfurtransferase
MQSHIIKIGNVTKTNITTLTETIAIPTISAKNLRTVIEKNVYQLVDIRTSEEHDLFNIGGRNVPVYELEKNVSVLYNGKDIVMYCSSGKRSSEAVKLMRNKFPGVNIFSLEGGLKAWQEDA